MTNSEMRSPINWIGGKFNSAARIVAAFPPPDTYDVYVEPFGGGAHVFFEKPTWNQLEVYNDLNGDLVNFWMMARDRADALAERLRSLPYSRSLYYSYHRKLWAQGEEAENDPLERAVLWFYVQRSAFSGIGSIQQKPTGWGYAKRPEGGALPGRFQSAIDLLDAVRARFRLVQIDDRDFGRIIKTYEAPRTLLYCDPPYLGAEGYYSEATGPFTRADHERLADLLNATPSAVALSYYEHPDVDRLYPAPKWRKMRWTGYKTAKKGDGAARLRSSELLLMNYRETHGGLWNGTCGLGATTPRENEIVYRLEAVE